MPEVLLYQQSRRSSLQEIPSVCRISKASTCIILMYMLCHHLRCRRDSLTLQQPDSSLQQHIYFLNRYIEDWVIKTGYRNEAVRIFSMDMIFHASIYIYIYGGKGSYSISILLTKEASSLASAGCFYYLIIGPMDIYKNPCF